MRREWQRRRLSVTSIISSILAVHQLEQTLVVTTQDFRVYKCNRAASGKIVLVETQQIVRDRRAESLISHWLFLQSFATFLFRLWMNVTLCICNLLRLLVNWIYPFQPSSYGIYIEIPREILYFFDDCETEKHNRNKGKCLFFTKSPKYSGTNEGRPLLFLLFKSILNAFGCLN